MSTMPLLVARSAVLVVVPGAVAGNQRAELDLVVLGDDIGQPLHADAGIVK